MYQMTLNEYQEQTDETAIYSEAVAYEYLFLGLAGEAGEVAGKYAKTLRDNTGFIYPEQKEAMLDELGDVLWFVAQIASLFDVSLD